MLDTTELRYYAAEPYRLKGALLLQQAVPDAAQAEACFQQALDVARQQQAKSFELRTATSLARLWQSQDKLQVAYDLLAPVYDWFKVGSGQAGSTTCRNPTNPLTYVTVGQAASEGGFGHDITGFADRHGHQETRNLVKSTMGKRWDTPILFGTLIACSK